MYCAVRLNTVKTESLKSNNVQSYKHINTSKNHLHVCYANFMWS